jgi:nitroreductase
MLFQGSIINKTMYGGNIMEVMDAIYTRRSIRRFKESDVSDDIIRQVIKAASYAPSAHNGQPWEFIITRDNEKKRRLDEGRTWTRFLPKTPVVIVVCAKLPEKSPEGSNEQGAFYRCVQDTAIAAENLLLAAHGLGLGTCWVGDFDENTVRNLFSIPEGYAPVALIALGYPAHIPPAPPKRRPVDEIVHWESFEKPNN